ncbi:MAG TPA: proton-conducting transporter membrane subunit, partial [Dissulfurispiraceae bacterium]
MDSLTPLPVALPLLMAAALLIVEKAFKRHARRRALDTLAFFTAAGVVLLDCLLLARAEQGNIVYWFGGWRPESGFATGIAFVIDPVGAGMAAFTGILTCLSLFYAWHYFKAIGPFFHSLMLVFLASMTGFCLTGDLFNMFVFFELMGVAAYALTGYKIEDTGPLEGALNFSVMNSIGAILVLAGIALVYARTGALNMAQAGRALSSSAHPDYLVFMSLGLLVIGFFVKAAIVPFHFWLPDAHTVAPTPVSVLFSGIMVELGLYAAARLYWTVYHAALAGHAPQLREALLIVGTVTCLLGAIMCFTQRHLKRMLAFSTVSHAGIMTAGIGMLDEKALAGTFLYLLGHGFVKGALFLCAGMLLHRLGGIDEVSLHNRGRRLKIAATVFLVGGL